VLSAQGRFLREDTIAEMDCIWYTVCITAQEEIIMKKIVTLCLCAMLVLGLFGCGKGSLEEGTVYYADIVIADYGTITVKLDQQAAPITVENFVNLANQGFYNGLTFHRIIEGFMMQGGASENPPASIVGEFSSNGYENPLLHTRGAISMARTSVPDSASSQFFIVHQDASHLDGKYACF
jgi:peptidyl-prolyl cis-trans isomerase B (cyclophilin B)